MKCPSLASLGLTLFAAGLMGVALIGCGSSAAESAGDPAGAADYQPKTSLDDPARATGKGMAAMRQAADTGKYLFVFFSKTNDAQTVAMRKVFDAAMTKAADRAQSIAVDVTDAAETSMVDKFDVSRAPMPLVLAIAPNGAITGGFPTQFEEQELLDAFATPATEKLIKPLQDGKLVFVCVQNGTTTSNDAALRGVRDFKADGRFASATEIVTLDPADKAEAGLLTDLQVPSDTKEAVTVFVLPPGQAIAKIEGATSKDALVELLSKANTGCGPGGCGPEGCAPK